MPSESEVADSVAALDKRFQSMSALCQVLAGHVALQRRDLRALQSAIGSPPAREEKGRGAPSDISADMLG